MVDKVDDAPVPSYYRNIVAFPSRQDALHRELFYDGYATPEDEEEWTGVPNGHSSAAAPAAAAAASSSAMRLPDALCSYARTSSSTYDNRNSIAFQHAAHRLWWPRTWNTLEMEGDV